ncbi:MAG: hypothetical protein R6X12_01720 [bacterium]
MPVRKTDSGGVRAPRRGRGKKSGGLGPIIGVLVLLVAVAVAVVLVTGRKPAAGSKARASRATSETAEGTRTSRRASRVRVTQGSRKRVDREARRAERARRRSERRRTSRRSRRSESKGSIEVSGGRSSRSSGRRAAGQRVDAILTDKSGGRYALVNTRPVRPGDMVDGRRITGVEAEQVKVEYGGQTYSVRIGQSLY